MGSQLIGEHLGLQVEETSKPATRLALREIDEHHLMVAQREQFQEVVDLVNDLAAPITSWSKSSLIRRRLALVPHEPVHILGVAEDDLCDLPRHIVDQVVGRDRRRAGGLELCAGQCH